jgi:UDP-2,3-diacylglucosamine pyrophosphatase LpxH
LRTLVISDLHLGNRARHDVLRRSAPRQALLDALDGVDRLVLLGDTLELMSRHPGRSMTSAEPILRAIGQRLGPDREVIFVPGNHDAPLVRAWVLAQGARLAPGTSVDPGASPALRRVLSWLAPASARVNYPGVWLTDRVWATHGHYLDRHLIPESAFGLPRGRLRRGRGRHARPIEYERRHRRGARSRDSLLDRALSRPVATLLESVAELVRVATLPRVPTMLMDARLAPLTSKLIDAQMRHASIPAMARVAQRLGIDADFVIFGHVHRLGPLAGDRWPSPGAGPSFINCGSWLYEPLLVDRATTPHPYWPGGAVLLDSAGSRELNPVGRFGRAGSPGGNGGSSRLDPAPRAVGLLDGLGADQLRPAADRAP